MKRITLLGLVFVFISLFSVIFLPGCSLIFERKELTADDFPMKEKTTYAVYVNEAGRLPYVKVSFKLEGPWDFSKGPKDLILRSVIVNKSRAANASQFPEASVAEKILPGRYTSGYTIFNFLKRTNSALLLYGQSKKPKDPYFKLRKYSQPERLLKFPLKVGDQWVDKFRASDAPSATVIARRKVVGKGTIRVPAGVFRNTFLVQIKRTIESETGEKSRTIWYVWWTPEVGPVAWIISQPNQKKEVFKEADYFYRLKEYHIPD